MNKTYFNVYKIDVELIWKDIMKQEGTPELNKVCKKILRLIKSRIEGDNSTLNIIELNELVGLVFTKENIPVWRDMIEGANSLENIDIMRITNKSSSFLFLSIIDTNVFACTGGYASSYVKPYIMRNYGLNILTKLFEETDPVIKTLTERNMTGRRQSQTAINRSFTEFKTEKDFDKIFKNVNAQTNYNILQKLGLLDDDDTKEKHKTYNVISGDSLVIRKRMSLQEYVQLLEKLNDIDNQEPKFAMSYFVPCTDYKISKSLAFEKFADKIVREDSKIIEETLVTGSNYLNYINSSQWILFDDVNNIIINHDEKKIEFEDIVDEYEKTRKISKTGLINMLNTWKISTYRDNGEVHEDKIPVKEMIDVSFNDTFEIESELYGDQKISKDLTLYLQSGSWYVLDINYEDFIVQRYIEINDPFTSEITELFKKYDLNRRFNTETEYNESFANDPVENVIYTDKKFIRNVEICDLIVFDDNCTYFVCNKKEASGAGSRDVLNQIVASMKIYVNDRESFRGYYQKLVDSGYIDQTNISEEEFMNKIKDVKYVANYVTKGIRNRKDRTTYSKLLTINTSKLLKSENIDLITTSPLYSK